MSIVITGSPGVGKHTLARGIAARLGRTAAGAAAGCRSGDDGGGGGSTDASNAAMPVIDINDVARRAGLLADGRGRNRASDAPETIDVDTDRLAAALREEIAGSVGGEVEQQHLIVGHLAPYVLSPDQVGVAVILRRDPRDLQKVYRDRGYSDNKTTENVQAETLGVIAHDAMSRFREKAFQVDATAGIGPTLESAISIISTMRGGDDTIDWLGGAYGDGRLDEIFDTCQRPDG